MLGHQFLLSESSQSKMRNKLSSIVMEHMSQRQQVIFVLLVKRVMLALTFLFAFCLLFECSLL